MVMGEEEVKVAKDFSMVERVERITVGSEVAADIQLTLGELAAVEVTPGELEVLMKIPLVVEEEDLLTVGQIRKMNVVIIRLEMVKRLSPLSSDQCTWQQLLHKVLLWNFTQYHNS